MHFIVCVYVYLCVYMYVNVCVCMYVCMHVYIWPQNQKIKEDNKTSWVEVLKDNY